jgi:hypothetical protein
MLYVAMWESWHEGEDCVGGDLFYTHDEDKAIAFLHALPKRSDFLWDEEEMMYVYRNKYEWDKYYVDERPMEMEL